MVDPTLKELIEKNKRKKELDYRIKNLIQLKKSIIKKVCFPVDTRSKSSQAETYSDSRTPPINPIIKIESLTKD